MDEQRRCTRDRCASRDRETEIKQEAMKYGWTEKMYKRQMFIETQRDRDETRDYEI